MIPRACALRVSREIIRGNTIPELNVLVTGIFAQLFKLKRTSLHRLMAIKTTIKYTCVCAYVFAVDMACRTQHNSALKSHLDFMAHLRFIA